MSSFSITVTSLKLLVTALPCLFTSIQAEPIGLTHETGMNLTIRHSIGVTFAFGRSSAEKDRRFYSPVTHAVAIFSLLAPSRSRKFAKIFSIHDKLFIEQFLRHFLNKTKDTVERYYCIVE